MTYDADIADTGERGLFMAQLRGNPVIVVDGDPEHALCHAMVHAGLQDGPIQFYRAGVPSISFRSMHRAAGMRITLGDEFPGLRKRREGYGGNPSGSHERAIGGGDLMEALGRRVKEAGH